MSYKVFVSYKYKDQNVQSLFNIDTGFCNPYTTVRDYVDLFEKWSKCTGNVIYKGESDGEDLSMLTEETIAARLRNRIYDSSVTIVFVSQGMRTRELEKNQWIPWEVKYSLKETERRDRVSHSNALLCVVLPDISGDYRYYNSMKHFEIICQNIINGYAYVVPWNVFANYANRCIESALYNQQWKQPFIC